MSELEQGAVEKIAVIGMSGRFPGASNLDEFWSNLCAGTESIRKLTPQELRDAGVPEDLRSKRNFVAANALVADIEKFDAEYFDYTRREAETTDPQHRILLELSDEALTAAGYCGRKYSGKIGVFVGCGNSGYFERNVAAHPDIVAGMGRLQGAIAGSASFVATKISYKLGLTGPSMTVDTACSTSLVAIHQACCSLLLYESDMALAGGAAIEIPQAVGHLYQDGGIASPDGHCRAFDADAKGTTRGYGAGVVLLKRLADAIADGDPVLAVVLASAVNNDGNVKPGYTAASVEGQREVIAATHALAGITADQIGYVEAHGTATPLGDPVEIEALSQAFRVSSTARQHCGIGSLKTNIGHLDIAAGVAGFIKTVLVLRHGRIPPSLHYRRPNPKIDFAASPFYVVDRTMDWRSDREPRRAGVSSFGIGGTNAHVLLESFAQRVASTQATQAGELLCFSAHSESALKAMLTEHERFFEANPELDLAAVAFTLNHGRRDLPFRASLFAQNARDAAALLGNSRNHSVGRAPKGAANVAFMFSGQGEQRVQMMKSLFDQYPVFRGRLTACAERVRELAGWDLLSLLYPPAEGSVSSAHAARLAETQYTQPALFSVEYALASLIMSWGVRPTVMIGHSLGEYVAATLAGVWTLDEALRIVVNRARLMQSLPGGAMLAVAQDERDVREYLDANICLASVNAPGSVVLSASVPEIARVRADLESKGVTCQMLNTSHAFHSRMMEPILDDFRAVLSSAPPRAPTLGIVSNVTGELIAAGQATDVEYWVRHLRSTVRFAAGIQTLKARHAEDLVALEVGPGATLTSLAIRNGLKAQRTIALLREHGSSLPDHELIRQQLGRAWCWGACDDRRELPAASKARVALPTYPYQREVYWLNSKTDAATQVDLPAPLQAVGWGEQPLDAGAQRRQPKRCLTLHLWPEHASQFHDCARELGIEIVEQMPADRCPDALIWFSRLDGGADALEQELVALGEVIQRLHQQYQAPELRLLVCTRESLRDGTRWTTAEAAALSAATLVASVEFPHCRASALHLGNDAAAAKDMARIIFTELATDSRDGVIAYSGMRRLVPRLEKIEVAPGTRLKQQGCYLVVGGCGGIGEVLTRHLASNYGAKLVLLGRSERARVADLLEDLRRIGAAEVIYHSVDVTDYDALQRVASQLEREVGRIDGIIHAAGVIHDGSWLRKDESTLRAVLAAKVAGTRHLDRCFSFASMDFVVLCSTVGTLVGVPFQVDYLAANAFLDGYAWTSQSQNVCSINWGMWREVSHARDANEVAVEVQRNRALGISNRQAIAGFEQALALRLPQLVVATLEQLELLRASSTASDRAKPRSVVRARSHEEVRTQLMGIWSLLLGVEQVPGDASFFQLGGDSLLMVQQGRLIEEQLGAQVSLVELFNHPTLDSLSTHIHRALAGAPDAAPAVAIPKRHSTASNDVAIIAMAIKVPGAETLAAFWDNLRAGRDCISQYSDSQLLQRGVEPATLRQPRYVKAGYELQGIDEFDAGLFGFTPQEAALTDPQQRMLLECCHEALTTAGYEAERTGSRTGVFVGTAMSTYLLRQLLPDLQLSSQSMVESLQVQTGNSQDYAATQIAYRVGATGPAINVNSACSTSLMAVHFACQAVLRGECEIALAGGASIRVPQSVGYQYAEGSVESATGSCRPFDAEADGTIMSSGVGAIVVKRLSSALRDGDHIHAVIKGSAVNNDGSHKVSFAAPSVAGQHSVIAQALSNANVPPASISYVEAHGTGTKLGDPIEISALMQALGAQGERCEIGAVKSNIGHLDTAAGIAGLIKTVLMLERQQRVPIANFRRLNPLIELSGTRFEIATQARPWSSAGQPLRAGVSSFGIGGSNAHVILEAAPRIDVDSIPGTGSPLMLISANSAAALMAQRQCIEAALARMDRGAREHAAYTLAVGRKHREYRQAFLLHDDGGITTIGADTARVVPTDASARSLTLVLSKWDALPLEWIEQLSERFAEFRRNLDEVCRAAGEEIGPAACMRAAQLPDRGREIARFGLAYALLKSLASWIEFDIVANDGDASLLSQAISGRAPLAAVIGEYVKSRTESAAVSRAGAAESTVSGKEGLRRQLFDPSPTYSGAGLDARMSDGSSALLAFIGALWLDGVSVDWANCYRERAVRIVPLPPYPYQRQRYWYASSHQPSAGSGNGPVLRQASAPRRQRPADHLEPYVGPRNSGEAAIVDILGRVLGVDGIGVHDDFFALGGHSLLATRMIEELREAFGVAIAVEDVFERLTAAQMAEFVESQRLEHIEPHPLTDVLESSRQAVAP